MNRDLDNDDPAAGLSYDRIIRRTNPKVEVVCKSSAPGIWCGSSVGHAFTHDYDPWNQETASSRFFLVSDSSARIKPAADIGGNSGRPAHQHWEERAASVPAFAGYAQGS
jgi:hypothetical protein